MNNKAPEINIEEMSDEQLAELRNNVEAAAKERTRKAKETAIKTIRELVTKNNLDVKEVLRSISPARKTGTSMYANPDKPTQTWTGAGRKPKWVHDALEKGMSIEDLKIKK